MKILMVTNIPSPYAVDLFYYMQSNVKQFDVYVLYTSRTEDNREWGVDEKKLINSLFAQSKVIKVKTMYDHRYIHIPAQIGSLVDSIDPDIIIAWEYNIASIQSARWCKKRSKKFISLTEGTLLTESKLWLVQKLSRKYITRRADAFLVSSTKAKEKLLNWGINEDKIFIELLTVDVEPYLQTKRNTITNRILYVGSFAKRKGVDLLIEALPFLTMDYEVHLVGNGTKEEVDYLKELAESKGVDKSIKWCGYKSGDELCWEYSEAAVFVLPTREDCFGLVLLEALAARVPIVSSLYADGAYDIVEQGINGFLIDPYNSKEMSLAIENVLSNPLRNIEWEMTCERIVDKFKYSEVVKGFIEAIDYVKKGRLSRHEETN